METNILGLPSLTGYTPLKSALEGQVLKYNFRGIGPIATDKSGNGNNGRLKPRDDPPRRKIRPTIPPEVVMVFEDPKDRIEVEDSPSLRQQDFTVDVEFIPHEAIGKNTGNHFWIQKKGPIWSGSWGLAVGSWGQLQLRLAHGAGGYHMVIKRGWTAEPGEVHRVTAGFGDRTARLYYNKELIAEQTLPDFVIPYSEQPLVIPMKRNVGVSFNRVTIYDELVEPS